jgi:hypothetical protein
MHGYETIFADKKPRVKFQTEEIQDIYQGLCAVRRQILNSSEANWGASSEWQHFKNLVFFLFGERGMEQRLLRLDGVLHGWKSNDEQQRIDEDPCPQFPAYQGES